VLALAGLFAVILISGWWFVWNDQLDLLTARQQDELKLKEEFVAKKTQAVNLDLYVQQLSEIDRSFGALLKQLPSKSEVESLLIEINQSGMGRGLQFELFKPGANLVKEFYAEMPIDIRVTGGYHELGDFASDVAGLPRIVTLNNVAMSADKDGRLKLEAKAVTYRYLDDDELAKQRQAAKAAKGKKR